MAELKMMDSRLTESEQLEKLSYFNGIDFQSKLQEMGIFPLLPNRLEIFQINIGKMCNQTCKHCHVDAGPDRKEIMTRETMQMAIDAIAKSTAHTIDITGGAPEMNPNFYWFISELKKLNRHIMVRSNLTILRTKKHESAIRFFADNQLEVVSSLPFYQEKLTDIQRGNGTFRKSIEALQALNEVGYGKTDGDLKLNLVYNPVGAYLPGDQKNLEMQYKDVLKRDFNIEFNQLYCITNMPISRFLEYLIDSDNYEDYMQTLLESFNPIAALNVMCRNTISVSWDGYLYDCDFNQMLEMKVKGNVVHLKDWNNERLQEREIRLANHCYGCTAGSGSSCGGTVV